MSEVCHDVSTEPPIQPLSGESLSLRTANQDVCARLDIKASGFWGSWFEPTFLMLEYLTLMPLQTVVIPIASMKLRSAVSMRRECERWNMVILVLLFFQLLEAWVPPPLAYKRLAFLLSCKWKSPYCRVMSWLRCRLGFSLLHSAIMCIRQWRIQDGAFGANAPPPLSTLWRSQPCF